MKKVKIIMLGVFAIMLAISLSACGQKKSSQNGVTMSDILNAKKQHKIIVTDKHGGNSDIVWAGFIGEGKIEGIYLYSTDYDYGFQELKDQNNKDYKDNLTAMGEDSASKSNKPTFSTSKAKTELYTEHNDASASKNDDLADFVSYKVNFKNTKMFKQAHNLNSAINDTVYYKADKSKDGKWFNFYPSKNSYNNNYQMHIQIGDNNLKPKMENVKNTVGKYKNAKENKN